MGYTPPTPPPSLAKWVTFVMLPLHVCGGLLPLLHLALQRHQQLRRQGTAREGGVAGGGAGEEMKTSVRGQSASLHSANGCAGILCHGMRRRKKGK